jgi:hypothetical protein
VVGLTPRFLEEPTREKSGPMPWAEAMADVRLADYHALARDLRGSPLPHCTTLTAR